MIQQSLFLVFMQRSWKFVSTQKPALECLEQIFKKIFIEV